LGYTYGGDAVGVATVHNGGGLGAVSGVLGENLSGDIGGDSANGNGSESGDRETHCDRFGGEGIRRMFVERYGHAKCKERLVQKNVIGRITGDRECKRG
jgi:hypothetical protein